MAVAGLMLLSSFIPAQSMHAQAKPAPKPLTLKVGDTAPDFTLLAFDGAQLKKVSLHDYQGKKNVALAFYVFAFTGG
jgi:peroxiredoxin